jgi:hypothetical protein
MKKILLVSLCLVLVASFAVAKNATNGKSPANLNVQQEVKGNVSDSQLYPIPRATAQPVTNFLAYYDFEAGGGTCTDQGWVSVDITAQVADYFHVTDFTTPPDDCGPGSYGGLVPLEGYQSLWCGICPSALNPWCGYAVLPGYGNGWNQAWCTKDCLVTADTCVTVDYMIAWDSEPGYDGTTLEYTACVDPPNPATEEWVAEGSVNGGAGVYDGVGYALENICVVSGEPSLRLRFHFTADGAWSDEDGLWDTDGAVIIDSLTVRDSFGILVAMEDFEDEAVGDTETQDWESCTPPGYGDLAQLIQAVPTTYQNDPVEEDPCYENFSCLWNFVLGSTTDYACNTPQPSPQQLAVPYVNARDQYISNEIWSPWIPYTGSGAVTDIEFLVYRDLKLDALIFYVWHVRSNVAGCGTSWTDRNFVYYGGGKDWLRVTQPVGDIIEPGATDIQVALGVTDMCLYWCGIVGTGNCHAHAPFIDEVNVYRVVVAGPQWSVRDIDQFHDTFSEDGSIIGTCNADMAQDILPSTSPNITHGDSACVTVSDPEVGLNEDTYTTCGPAVYCYISVDPAQYGTLQKEAPEMRDMHGTCGVVKRYPYVFTTGAAGRTWDVYRMDSVFTVNGGLVADRYCMDFNDDLFVPGDTCWFFYGA